MPGAIFVMHVGSESADGDALWDDTYSTFKAGA